MPWPHIRAMCIDSLIKIKIKVKNFNFLINNGENKCTKVDLTILDLFGK